MPRGRSKFNWTWNDYRRELAKAELSRQPEGEVAREEEKALPPRDPIFETIVAQLDLQPLDLAQRAHVHPSTLYYWHSGRTRNPRLDTLRRVATALGLNIEMAAAPRHGNVVDIKKTG